MNDETARISDSNQNADYVAVPEGEAGQEDAALRRGGATVSPSGLLSIPDPINDFTPEQRAALEAYVRRLAGDDFGHGHV